MKLCPGRRTPSVSTSRSGSSSGLFVRSLALFVVGTTSVLLFNGGMVVEAFPAAPGLLDPDGQPKFVEVVPEALAGSSKITFKPKSSSLFAQLTQSVTSIFSFGRRSANEPVTRVDIGVYSKSQETGIIDPVTKERLKTPVFAYGTTEATASWPGPTLEAKQGSVAVVQWLNKLNGVTSHPFTSLKGKSVLDTSLHWAYSLPDYKSYSMEADGIPLVTHLHGVHSGPNFDGQTERFYSPDFAITGPAWVQKDYDYPNDQTAGTLWYHDHTLGITRLNVYSGLSGFYLVRDEFDTGKSTNTLNLPSGDYEKAYSIQDKMFKTNGEMFYASHKGEPRYADWITQETDWDSDVDGASILGEFFGDFMVVNGKIWPKQAVLPRGYRFRLLNGCDSRFLVLKFVAVEAGAKTAFNGTVVPYTIVGSDQGLANAPLAGISSSLIETGARLDIVINFRGFEGKRIIMTNSGGDVAFQGELPGIKTYDHTSVIMAFDVDSRPLQRADTPPAWNFAPEVYEPVAKVRRVGLFEARDQYNRLQPMLGGEKEAGIVETLTWHEPITETIDDNAIEEWEIYNFSTGAHPMHLHLVHVEVVGRYPIVYDSKSKTRACGVNGAVDGVCLQKKVTMQHDGIVGGLGTKALFPPSPRKGYNPAKKVTLGAEYSSEKAGKKDVFTALPGQVTVIRAKFDKIGKFVWHCHFVSHEDHEMMRNFEVIRVS